MKKNVLLLSTLRKPMRMFLLLLIMSVISSSFISRAVEYLVLNREIGRISEYYHAIGTLENSSDGIVTKGVPIVGDSKAVAFEDVLRVSSGVLQGLHNVDIDGRSSDYPGAPDFSDGVHVSDVLIYGTLNSKELFEKPSDSKLSKATAKQFKLSVTVDYVEAGYPEYVQVGQSVTLLCSGENRDVVDSLYESLLEGERYFLRAYYHPDTYMLQLKPIIDELWVCPVQAGEVLDFNSPKLDLSDELAVMKENQSAVTVIATKDMSSMPYVQPIYPKEGRHYLTVGRWPDREDDINANRVCVVRQEFADLRGVSVGDTITLKMRDLKESYLGYIISDEDRKNWEYYETHTGTFEIVGIYGVMTSSISGLTSRNNNIYVPNSCMPLEFGVLEDIYQGDYSFVLNSPKDIQSFTEETRDALSALGMRVLFMENGWEGFYASTESILRSASLNTLMFGFMLILAVALVALIYLRGQRSSFAIMRALGVAPKKAIAQMLIPMLGLSAIAVAAGGIISWRYTLDKVSETLASFETSSDITVSASLPFAWLVLFGVGIVVLLLVLTLGGALLLARRPVLRLMQDTSSRVKVRKEDAAAQADKLKQEDLSPTNRTKLENTSLSGKMPKPAANRGIAQTTRYVLRHIARVPVRTFLVIVLPVCFIVAIGWIHKTIVYSEDEVSRLYDTTVVEGDIVKANASVYIGKTGAFIRKHTIDELINTGFIKDLAAVAVAEAVAYPIKDNIVQIKNSVKDIFIYAFDHSERFFDGLGKGITVEYASGLDETILSKEFSSQEEFKKGSNPYIIIPEGMLEHLGIKLGDNIMIESNKISLTFIVAGKYSGASIHVSSGYLVFMPLSVLTYLQSGQPIYISAEFSIDSAKNRELATFLEQANDIVGQSGAGLTELRLLLWDDELTKVVEPLEKNIELLTVLYPVTVAVSAVIAMVLSLLLLMQRSKETAIMRVLGVRKMRVCFVLTLEQIILCFVGIILGLSSLVFLDGTIDISLSIVLSACIYFGGTLLGALLGAGFATRRNSLELLQVKE